MRVPAPRLTPAKHPFLSQGPRSTAAQRHCRSESLRMNPSTAITPPTRMAHEGSGTSPNTCKAPVLVPGPTVHGCATSLQIGIFANEPEYRDHTANEDGA